MTLENRLAAFASAVGIDVKTLKSNQVNQRDFSRAGNLVVLTGTLQLPVGYSCTVDSAMATLAIAPTGANAILDIKKNGVSIYGTVANRPTFLTGQSIATVGAHTPTSLVSTDRLTVDILQIGSTTPGAELVLSIFLRRIP